MIKGLTSEEVKKRLSSDGYNELPSPKSKNLLSILKEIIKEPMFILLIGCGTLYMVLGDFREGIVMLCMISLIISITFFQHRKTEKALEALRILSSPRALVYRDGEWIRIPGREVVVGDIVKLEEGDRIPADGKLIESMNLQVDESIITGESFPVSHNVDSEVLSGTLVTKGSGQLEVSKTGIKTEFGKIGMSLQSIEDKQTALQSEMKKLIRKLALAGILICVIVVAVFYLTRGNFLHALLNGLASAMAILPEEFPVVLTVFLALGAWRLSKKNVLTRKPSAIETLGSATVLCSDKTGTITINKMMVKQLAVFKDNTLINGLPDAKTSQEILISAMYASFPEGSDPMEKAITEACSFPVEKMKIVHDFPLTHEFLAMTRIYNSDQEEVIAFSKGAPEAIMELCKLSDEVKEDLKKEIIRMASNGLRVIGVAATKNISKNIPVDQKELHAEFKGFIGFEDPIRKEVPAAVQECLSAGIRIIMITGDYPETARNIGEQIGLNTSNILHGEEMKQLSPDQLTEKLKTVSILARIKPEQKLQIVQSLQSNGEIVAMTGDGVNDAPALKAADIGIAMGMKGTDVAREASSLVILDDNFASIVGAVSLGRRIFDNLQKAMSYILAIHIPIIGLALLPAFFVDFPILMLPLHIIFMELIIDPVSSIAFETEKDEKDIMIKPPRSKSKAFFGKSEIIWSIFDGIMLLSSVLIVFLISKEEGHSVEQLRAICFITLMMGNVFLILSKLSYSRYFYRTLFGPNHAAKIILLISCSILVIMLSVPGINDLFQMQFPGIKHLIISFAGAAVLLCVLEVKKYIRNSRSIESGRH